MEKYNEIQRGIIQAKNELERGDGPTKDLSSSSYTYDSVLVKKESVVFPKEIEEVFQEGGHGGLVCGLNIVWASARGRVVLWNFVSSLVHEMETRTREVLAVYPTRPKPGVFVGDVHACLLLFTEKEVSLVCLCSNPAAFVNMEMSATLPVQMASICETRNGRVLMGGADGHIYEFAYGGGGWTGGGRARVISCTSSALSYVLPFLYPAGRKAAVQIAPTKRGALVLYEDNSVEVFELEKKLRRVGAVDLGTEKIRTEEKTQLVAADGGGYEAYLVREDGTRLYIDGKGAVVGKRALPPARTHRAGRGGAGHSVTNEKFFGVGKHLVVLGKKEEDVAVSLVSPNKGGSTAPENFCTIIASRQKYRQASLVSPDVVGREAMNRAESLVKGEEIALLGQGRVDVYQALGGVEVMERAVSHPEGLFSFRQRHGPEYALVCALYSASLGMPYLPLSGVFRKSPELQRNAVTACASIAIYGLWEKDLMEVLSSRKGTSADASVYLEEVERAVEKLERLKKFVVRESQHSELLVIERGVSVVQMVEEVVQVLRYIEILLETDGLYVLTETKKRLKEEERRFGFSLSTFLNSAMSHRSKSLDVLIDTQIAQSTATGASVDAITATLSEKCPSVFALSETFFIRGKETLERAARAENEEDRRWFLEKSAGYFEKVSREQMEHAIEMYADAKYPLGVLRMVRAGARGLTREEAAEYFLKTECTEELLREGLREEQPMVCAALLDAAVQKIRAGELPIDVLLRAKSAYLEEYLDVLDRTSQDLEMCDLAWKYHLKNKNYKTASLYLFRTAERRRPFITLQKRIEYLAMAATTQSAAEAQTGPVTGAIKDYAPRLGTSGRERLKMANRQAEVMTSVANVYHPGEAKSVGREEVSEVFGRLENELLSYEELFSICVMFGFSLLALKIAENGEIEDSALRKTLWEDALSGEYASCVQILKENREMIESGTLELIADVLVRRKVASKGEGVNVGAVLLDLGFSQVGIARVLEEKALSTEHSMPENKKVILEEAAKFCELQNMRSVRNRILEIKSTLGL